MEEILKALVHAEKAYQATSELSGRTFGIVLAVVADVADPMQLARVRVMLPSKGAKTLSDWLVRLTPSKYWSQPLVSVGDTVAVSFVNGDPNQGVYLGSINNIPQPPAVDSSQSVHYKGETAIVQNDEAVTLIAGSASLTLHKNGSLAVSGVTSFTVNGKEVLTLGAKDTDGDTSITKGWS